MWDVLMCPEYSVYQIKRDKSSAALENNGHTAAKTYLNLGYWFAIDYLSNAIS